MSRSIIRSLLLVASVLVATVCVPATPLPAQDADGSSGSVAPAPWRVTVTVFRSPGTGLQLSRGALAFFVAHYPTIIERDGAQRTTQFVRLGAALYARAEARTSPYISVSIAPSLTRGWTTSGLLDVGVRQRFTTRLSGQLGVAALYAPALNATRVNPTIGLGVHF